MKCDDLTCD